MLCETIIIKKNECLYIFIVVSLRFYYVDATKKNFYYHPCLQRAEDN